MTHRQSFTHFGLAVSVMILLIGAGMQDGEIAPIASLAASEPPAIPGNPALAGQMCPPGSYVIGFDSEANIVCSEACGNSVLNNGETCDDGNTDAGDGCSPTCQSEIVSAGAKETEIVPTAAKETEIAEQVSPAGPVNDSSISPPVISKVKPSSAVFGTTEVSITIFGSGFRAGSVVKFNGTAYQPTVNQAGTQLQVTLPTAGLSINSYAITVSNGPGLETTRKRGLVIF